MQEIDQPTFSGFYFSVEKRDVIDRMGNRAGLRTQSAEVFRYLAMNHHRVVSRRELEDTIWAGVAVTEDSLTKCVSEIRKALGDDARAVLKTYPKRGYQLRADTPVVANETGTGESHETNHRSRNSPLFTTKRSVLLASVLVAALGLVALLNTLNKTQTEQAVPTLAIDGVPRLSVTTQTGEAPSDYAKRLVSETRSELDHYRTVVQVTGEADLDLQITHHSSNPAVSAQLVESSTGKILFAASYPDTRGGSFEENIVASRLAAAVASPGVGAIDQYLLETSRLIPPEELSPAACYAHGFGCSKCSGEEDSITRRAEACLASLLKKNPEDSRAWALQATIHAHQYWWANTLPEPMRSNPALRRHLPQKAIDAANKAESLSRGGDTAVYWGMAEAYFSACESDKLASTIERGLEINPNDPNLLGAFGNWLSYSGQWEAGKAMTLRAFDIEPVHYRKWWWMGPAKSAYVKGDYEQAYQYFLKSFSERSWMSHLQQAYTLPHLGRVDEARKSVATLQYIYPGFTRENALEIYQLLCFPDSFLTKMDEALTQAGLPSRGSSNDLSNLTLPRAKVVNLNGVDVEYLDVGNGEPVLFVHGAFNDYRTWGHYLVPVSEQHRYISYSRRYFGTQHWQDDGEQYSVEVFAQDLIDLIEALNLKGVHVVTWSSGVRTATAAAVLRPDLFKSLIHFEPVEAHVMQGMPDADTIQALGDAWNVNYGPIVKDALSGDEESALEKFYELVFEASPGSYNTEREILREVTRQNARTIAINLTRYTNDNIKLSCDYVSQIQVPTMIVHGEETHEYWKLMSQRFADCMPNASLASIADSNHYAPIEKIDAFSSLVLQFVDQHR